MPVRYKPPCLQADPKPLMKLYNPMGFYGSTNLICYTLLPSLETQGQLVGQEKSTQVRKNSGKEKSRMKRRALLLILDFSSPEFFLALLDFSRPH